MYDPVQELNYLDQLKYHCNLKKNSWILARLLKFNQINSHLTFFFSLDQVLDRLVKLDLV